MARAVLIALATVGVVALLASVATANDFFVRVQVLDCAGNPKTTDFVSLYGCVDAAGSNDPALTALSSSVIAAVSSSGYAGSTIPTVQQDPSMTCPYTDTTLGLKADYCSGSGNTYDCSLAVLKPDSTKSPPYVLDTDYDVKTGIFGKTLQSYVLTTVEGATLLYPSAVCPSPNAYCSKPIFQFKPKNCPTPPSCPACPAGSTNPTNVPIEQVSGETGYAYMCSLYSADPNTNPPTDYPSFISFRSNQKLFSSANPLVLPGNNWGYMGIFPTSYVSTDNGASCYVSGYIFAGQDTPAGTVKVYLTSSAAGSFKLNYSINLTPNLLQTVHVYFGCTPLSTNAPGKFGNTIDFSPPQSTYSGFATATGCTGNYVYMAIHVAIA